LPHFGQYDMNSHLPILLLQSEYLKHAPQTAKEKVIFASATNKQNREKQIE
jgi:hypothetical protein